MADHFTYISRETKDCYYIILGHYSPEHSYSQASYKQTIVQWTSK